jgi:hypothetical protein
MRKFGNEKAKEFVHSLNSVDPSGIPEVQASYDNTGPIIGSALEEQDPEVIANAPKAKWYRVLQGGTVLENGFRCRIKEGKEINSFNYNIRKLQQQGIRLVEFNPEELADDTVFA